MFRYANDIRSKDSSIGIYIINPDGQSIYPYRGASSPEGKNYYHLIKEDGLSMLKTHSITNSESAVKQAMTYTVSKFTGWTIIVVQSQSVILKSVNQFARLFALLSLLVIVITLVVSYLVSKNVTTPLKKLRNNIKSMELTDLSTNSQVFQLNGRQYVDEIEKLHYAFMEMNRKLGISLNEILTSKNEELNAKMLALQSQMNPHFLYNNLATISVMAEEEMNKQIVSLCGDISFMLRYISTEDRDGVKLQAEIEYTQKYLESMKIRYESDLNYDFEIEEGMRDVIVPKLIVQPLVENSIKFSLENLPPWRILITGKITDGKWIITVSDKGTGFDQTELQRIERYKEEFKQLTSMPDLKIGGMGLQNIYLRLRLLYKDSTIFEAENLPEGGASVTIGGDIDVPGKEEKQCLM
jgi:two-component system sensor histidine kinase YesM